MGGDGANFDRTKKTLLLRDFNIPGRRGRSLARGIGTSIAFVPPNAVIRACLVGGWGMPQVVDVNPSSEHDRYLSLYISNGGGV